MLNSAVTVVDVNKCRMYMKNFGEFFNNQIENAGTIVLSRTDVADPKKVQGAVEMLRQHNAKATIVTTPCSELTGAQLLEMIEQEDDMAEELMKEAREHMHEHHHHHDHYDDSCGCGHDHDHEHHHHDDDCDCGCHDHHHDHDDECGCGCHDHHHDHEGHHHADDVFTSWGLENVGVMKKEDLQKILDDLAYGDKYGEVLRAKGMVPSEEKGVWLHFDMVPEQAEIREGAPDFTGKVCVIGAELDEEGLKAAFNA